MSAQDTCLCRDAVHSPRSLSWDFLWMLRLALILDLCAFLALQSVAGVPLTDYIRHYEPVYYDHEAFHQGHHRVKRSSEPSHLLHLDIKAHGRTFKIRLKRDRQVYAPDLVIENSTGRLHYDTSRAYVGFLEGEPESYVHGIITGEGLFEGKIVTHDDQFVIERTAKYDHLQDQPFHSVIYRHSDVRMDALQSSLCLSDKLHSKMHAMQQNETSFNNQPLHQTSRRRRSARFRHESRPSGPHRNSKAQAHVVAPGRDAGARYSHFPRSRSIDPSKTTCTLYMQADHLFYEKYQRNTEVVIEQLTQHVQGVNEIYSAIDFDEDGSIDNINFIIKRIKVHTDSHADGYKFPGNYGVENFLELFSEENFDAFCLAYMFTYRDFDGGTLGLAWTGDLTNAGGVCERNGQFRGSLKSLNSGIVTVLNYGKDVPSTVSHVTMAHEMGHNMGSQHDPETRVCSPGGEDGNFIMFARATSGDKPNNNRFSDCSVESMASVMEVKARSNDGCFIRATSSICGNGVVEEGEECDCGWDDECADACCYPQSERPVLGTPCRRKPRAVCSPSEGPCCSASCQLIGPPGNVTCRAATECKAAGFCDGTSAACPDSVNMPDKTICDGESVCYIGECSGSICLAYNMEPCQCPPDKTDNFAHENLCKLCCQLPGEASTCSPSDALNDRPYDVPDLMAKSGAPCNNYLGYCDVFHKCREVDPSGPLSNLRMLFSSEGLASMKEWLQAHWYIVLLSFLGVASFMALLIKLCSPRKRKAPPELSPYKVIPPPPPPAPSCHSPPSGSSCPLEPCPAVPWSRRSPAHQRRRTPSVESRLHAPPPSCARKLSFELEMRPPPSPKTRPRPAPVAAVNSAPLPPPSGWSPPPAYPGFKKAHEGWV